MGDPTLLLRRGDHSEVLAADWDRSVAGEREVTRMARTVLVETAAGGTSVTVVWRGELWPKFTVAWNGVHRDTMTETLGNKLMIRVGDGRPT
jgi:hypothetical protein